MPLFKRLSMAAMLVFALADETDQAKQTCTYMTLSGPKEGECSFRSKTKQIPAPAPAPEYADDFNGIYSGVSPDYSEDDM
mmetsp:Transcript_28284/g.51050  ORF Transcript_28284/g.51050 Transcript_28284/m.51050 type:complete len:80 (-) Transcript_28284:194-433(-)|eukprot:CAMPEP_0197664546 /NCGR_PEP_ID=MMETSP1338-20131121/58704_1 /TAXON_ID=43686 ORGANISM="Pelagodinium beii, Strain RCC1491" /NCGR_SAMPLE_ID=MMETSP1338 /ASSEMBLY_ACC=CAM_ASM_000754 /LENGTH=79 /DNA_ID=CAMNT_0043243213 /DNA_START=52 /DNA_END=291 /DNA_ORIENTATION=-